jgi:hypothetical protein
MRYAISFVGLLGLGSLALYGCSSSSAGSADAGTDAPAAKADAGAETGPRPDGSTDAGSSTGPGSSCANAIAVDLSAETDGDLNAVGKSLFYTINVTAGDFLLLSASTAATADTAPGAVVDTAISVFDAAGTNLLANDDDAFPRYTTDAQFFYRAPATATLCVQVTDFDTWKGDTATLATDSTFKFFAGIISPDAEVVTFDKEPNDTTAAPQVGKLKAASSGVGGYSYLAGVLSGAADVDTYKFTVPTGAKSLNVTVPPIGAPLAKGASSYGSSMARFTATVKKLDGTAVAELLPPAGQVESMSDSLTAPVGEGDYYLVIGRPSGLAAGDNDFYATTIAFGAGNTPESEAANAHTNDTLAAAEALTMTADTANAKLKHGYILAYLPTGDVADNFSFAVGSGDSIAVACGAARNGSGLQSFKMELFVAGASKQSETEIATADLAWSSGKGASKAPVVASAAGTAVLQLTSGSASTTNTGKFYLCGVHVTSP